MQAMKKTIFLMAQARLLILVGLCGPFAQFTMSPLYLPRLVFHYLYLNGLKLAPSKTDRC